MRTLVFNNFVYHIVGLDVHREYSFDHKIKNLELNPQKSSYSVDDFDDNVISLCDDAVSNFIAGNMSKSEERLYDFQNSKSIKEEVIIIDDFLSIASDISSPIAQTGNMRVIPTPVSSASKKDMVPCKHKCKEKNK